MSRLGALPAPQSAEDGPGKRAMGYCPNCQADRPPIFVVCPSCNARLFEQPPGRRPVSRRSLARLFGLIVLVLATGGLLWLLAALDPVRVGHLRNLIGSLNSADLGNGSSFGTLAVAAILLSWLILAILALLSWFLRNRRQRPRDS